jgi:hypothetical protein
MKKSWILILAIGLFSCENNMDNGQKDIERNNGDKTVNVPNDEVTERVHFENEIDFAKYCAALLKEGNIDGLRPYTDGEILLSPYAYIQPETRKVTLGELQESTNEVHYWGKYDGSGDSILLSTPQFLNKFVLNFDISTPDIKATKFQSTPKAYGNEMHNVQKIYPNLTYVQFYKSASKKENMDWKALIYVVEKNADGFVLKAIVHSQWTV